MAEIIKHSDLMEKLTILSDAAKYDVACTSSGVDRRGNGKGIGNSQAGGICHAFTSDGRCISLLKILLSNECVYDCKYCVNRRSNDVKRTTFTPDELCELTIQFYRRNYIEGLFLSSGVVVSPDHTMNLMYETLWTLRMKYHFHGYIHVKGIPGASAEVVERIGYLADRMSINLELPTAEGLARIAPNKVRKNILRPMRQIQDGIKESRLEHGVKSMKSRFYLDEKSYYNQMAEIAQSKERLADYHNGVSRRRAIEDAKMTADRNWGFEPSATRGSNTLLAGRDSTCLQMDRKRRGAYFVPAGQSTQMIVGASGETDYEIISVTEALYDRFELKRVFYSAFINVNNDESLPGLMQPPPLLREHRLYQADFLLRFYGFKAGELLSESNPNFNDRIDPKCNWAVKHLEQFPVEVNQADYYTLLRVPGIGTRSAERILKARRHTMLDFGDIKKMGVVLKRAQYFLTCKGKMMYPTKIEENYITNHLISCEPIRQCMLEDGKVTTYEQLRLPFV